MGSIVIRCVMLRLLFLPSRNCGLHQRPSQIETIELTGGVNQAVQDVINFFRLLRIHNGSKGGDEPRAVINDSLRGAVTADALRACGRTAGVASASRGGTVARNPLLEQTQCRI